MTRASRFALAALAIMVAGAVTVLLRGTVGHDRSASELVRLQWPDDGALVYRLTHISRGRTVAGGGTGALSSDTALDLELVVAAVPGSNALRIHVAHVDTATLEVAGKVMLEDDSMLTAPVLEVALGPDGRFESVAFSADASPAYRNLMQFLLAELQLSPGPGPAWGAREDSPHGAIDARYRVASAGVAQVVQRTRARVEHPGATSAHIDGTTRFVVAGDGVLRGVDHDERVELGATAGLGIATTSETHLALIDRRAASRATARAHTPPLPVGRMVRTGDDRTSHLHQRAAGLDRDSLVAALVQHGRNGRMPDHNQFLVRATAVIALDPTAAEAPEGLFLSPDWPFEGRALLADLLAQAGTPEAQTSLRRVLVTDIARAEKGYPLLYQRLGFVRRPTAETLALAREHGVVDGMAGPAGVMTYGAVLGGRIAQGDGDADSEAAMLIERVAEAETPADKAVYLRAIGNADVDAYARGALDYTSHEAANVRHAAAMALRNARGPDVDRALAGMAGDVDPQVQTRALSSLRDRELDAQTTDTLADNVRNGYTVPTAYELVVDVAVRSGDPQRRAEIFTAVVEQPRATIGARRRARAMLDNPEVLARAVVPRR